MISLILPKQSIFISSPPIEIKIDFQSLSSNSDDLQCFALVPERKQYVSTKTKRTEKEKS